MGNKKNKNSERFPYWGEIILGVISLGVSLIPVFYREMSTLDAIATIGAALVFSVAGNAILYEYKIKKSISLNLNEKIQQISEYIDEANCSLINKMQIIEDDVTIDEIYKHIYEVEDNYGREFYSKKIKDFVNDLSSRVIDLYSNTLERNFYYAYLHKLADQAIEEEAPCWALTSFQETEWDSKDPLEVKWADKLETLNLKTDVRRVCLFSAKQIEMIKSADFEMEDAIEQSYFLAQLSYYIANNKNIQTYVVEDIGPTLKRYVGEGFFAVTFSSGKKLVRDKIVRDNAMSDIASISGEIDFNKERIEMIYDAWEELITCGAMTLDEYINTYSSRKVIEFLKNNSAEQEVNEQESENNNINKCVA